MLVYLSDKLERAGCITDHAEHDADVLIVQTAIASARTKDTVLVGDDTDLLILLLHHADLNAQEMFLAPEPKKATKTRRIWCTQQTKELLGPKVCDNLDRYRYIKASHYDNTCEVCWKGSAFCSVMNQESLWLLLELQR